VKLLKRIFFALILPITLLVLLVMLTLAPPHRFIVYGGPEASSGSFNDGYNSKPMGQFGRYFYASPDVGEGGATATIRLKNGTTKICGFGYFTSGDFQWQFMSLSKCDGRYR
jgi:hypothetical protein